MPTRLFYNLKTICIDAIAPPNPRVTAAGPRVRGPGDLGRGEPGHRAAAALLHPAAVRVLAGLQARHQVTSIK